MNTIFERLRNSGLFFVVAFTEILNYNVGNTPWLTAIFVAGIAFFLGASRFASNTADPAHGISVAWLSVILFDLAGKVDPEHKTFWAVMFLAVVLICLFWVAIHFQDWLQAYREQRAKDKATKPRRITINSMMTPSLGPAAGVILDDASDKSAAWGEPAILIQFDYTSTPVSCPVAWVELKN
jgi:hypothetical protein